jgi:hypothetical protein
MSSQPAYAPYSPDPGSLNPLAQPAPGQARGPLNLAALFASITGLLLISPVAIVLGHIGLAQVRRRRQSGAVLIATVAALVALVVFVNSGPTPPTSF